MCRDLRVEAINGVRFLNVGDLSSEFPANTRLPGCCELVHNERVGRTISAAAKFFCALFAPKYSRFTFLTGRRWPLDNFCRPGGKPETSTGAAIYPAQACVCHRVRSCHLMPLSGTSRATRSAENRQSTDVFDRGASAASEPPCQKQS